MAAPVDFEQFCQWAEAIVERLPQAWLRDLNGGIQITEDAPQPEDDDETYLLGEYIIDPYLGRMIRIHFGSFLHVFEDESTETWHAELEETILHEVQHHLEDLAGRDDLARQEALERALERLERADDEDPV